jgi:hypothetical protein
MIEKHLSQLFEELEIDSIPSFDKDGMAEIHLASFLIQIIKAENQTHLVAPVTPLPKKEKEAFLIKLMEANFLGQGTGGSVLGLQEDESFLTLSLDLPYEINYTSFKEAIEEFVNYLEYWKTEAVEQE